MAEEQIVAVIGQRAFDDVEKMLKLLDTAAQRIADVNNTVRNTTVEVKGAKSIEELATKTAKLQAETQELTGATVDYNRIAAQTEQVLKEVSGTQGQNLRLYAQYKAELNANRAAQSELNKSLAAGRVTMADYQTQMAGLVKQEQSAKIAQSELSATIKAGIKEEQAAAGSVDQMAQRLGQLKDAYRRMSEEERNSTGGKALLSSIQELDPAVKGLDASMGNHQRNVGNYPRTMTGAVAVLEKARAEMMQQAETVDKSSDTYVVLSAQIDHLNTVLESNATKYLSARTASRELENVSRELAESLGMESESFRAVSSVAGDFKNDVGDIAAAIKNLSSDTQTLDGVIGAAQGLAGAFAVADSTVALFGGQNDQLQESMQKLMAVMALMQGLQEVQNALQSESTAMMFANNVALKAKAVWQGVVNFAMTGSITTTAAATAATDANTAATVRATMASRAFRIALMSTGIGLLLVLLGSAASAMETYGSSTEDAAGDTSKLSDEAERLIQTLEKVANATERARNASRGGLDGLRRELDLMKAKGVSELEIQNKEQEIKQGEIRNLSTRAQDIQAEILLRRKRAAEEQKILDSGRPIKDNKTWLFSGTREDVRREAMKKRISDNISAANALEEKLLEINKEGLDKRNEMEASAATYQREQREKAAKKAEELRKKNEQKQKEHDKQAKELAERNQKAASELYLLGLQQQADGYKQLADDEKETLEVRLQATALYYQKEAELVNARAIAEKQQGEKTKTEQLLIDAQAKDEVLKLKTESQKAILEITESFLDEEVQLRQRGTQLLQQNIDSQEQEELQKLVTALTTKQITVEDYEKQREQIQNKYAKKRFQGTIDYLKEEIEYLAGIGADTTELQKELNEAQKELYQQDAENFKNAASQKEEAQKKLGAKLEDLGKEVFSTLVSMQKWAYESDIKDVDKRIADIDKEKDAEIKATNASALSQQEKQRKIAASEAAAQAKREELEARKRAIQIQAARFEKAANVAAIVGETALAVIRALGMRPWSPANIALAQVTAAIGAVQAARALAAPLPQYWKGRKNGPAEFAIVGERGSELVKHRDGKSYMTPGRPTLTFLPEGASVTPHDEVLAMARSGTLNALAATGAPATPAGYGREMIAQYQQAAAQIVDAITSKQETHISITERGLQTLSRKGNTWTEYLKANL